MVSLFCLLTNCYVRSTAKDHVHNSGHYFRVQSVLWRESCQNCVGDSLRDCGEGDGEPGNEVVGNELASVVWEPFDAGNALLQRFAVQFNTLIPMHFPPVAVFPFVDHGVFHAHGQSQLETFRK